MRVTSSLWVGAYVRRCHAAGAFAVVARRGAAEAGAILLVVDKLDNSSDLYGPAPQSEFDSGRPAGRRFQLMLHADSADALRDRLRREIDFDPDVWIVTVEDRGGRVFLDEGESAASDA